MKKKLSIGIQSFSKLIEGGYCYADKGPLLADLANNCQYAFLSRPRRFGKSLLVDTLAQIKARGYADKHAGAECYLIGVNFSREQRNITAFDWEKI